MNKDTFLDKARHEACKYFRCKPMELEEIFSSFDKSLRNWIVQFRFKDHCFYNETFLFTAQYNQLKQKFKLSCDIDR